MAKHWETLTLAANLLVSGMRKCRLVCCYTVGRGMQTVDELSSKSPALSYQKLASVAMVDEHSQILCHSHFGVDMMRHGTHPNHMCCGLSVLARSHQPRLSGHRHESRQWKSHSGPMADWHTPGDNTAGTVAKCRGCVARPQQKSIRFRS